MKTFLTQETEEKARKMAETIAKSSSVDSIETDDLTGDNLFLSDGILSYYGIILRACRKSVIDGFPLDEYFLDEVPCIEKNCVVAYFENIKEFGTGDNYNPEAHEIIFVCSEGENVAVPYAAMSDRGFYIEERANCFEAVHLLSVYD